MRASLLLFLFGLTACAHEQAKDELVDPTPAVQAAATTNVAPFPSGPLASDRAIEKQVRTLLALADQSPFDVRVESRRGRVSLSGNVVGDADNKARIESLVGSLRGVRSVKSELGVQAAAPATATDARPWYEPALLRLAILSFVALWFFGLGSRITRKRLEKKYAALGLPSATPSVGEPPRPAVPLPASRERAS